MWLENAFIEREKMKIATQNLMEQVGLNGEVAKSTATEGCCSIC